MKTQILNITNFLKTLNITILKTKPIFSTNLFDFFFKKKPCFQNNFEFFKCIFQNSIVVEVKHITLKTPH